jgi:hypothetical protein
MARRTTSDSRVYEANRCTSRSVAARTHSRPERDIVSHRDRLAEIHHIAVSTCDNACHGAFCSLGKSSASAAVRNDLRFRPETDNAAPRERHAPYRTPLGVEGTV